MYELFSYSLLLLATETVLRKAAVDRGIRLVMCDGRRDLQSIVCEVGISFGAVQSILTNILGMSKVSARWVPRMLTNDQERIFLGISCLDMKVISAILSSEL